MISLLFEYSERCGLLASPDSHDDASIDVPDVHAQAFDVEEVVARSAKVNG